MLTEKEIKEIEERAKLFANDHKGAEQCYISAARFYITEERQRANKVLDDLYESIRGMKHFGQSERIGKAPVMAKIKLAKQSLSSYKPIGI